MTTITIHDPRHMDGDPHEVAEIAGNQLVAVLEHASEALTEFGWAARGAWMTAEEHLTGDMPNSEKFWDTPQGKQINAMKDAISLMVSRANVSVKAASFNPRAPIGGFDE